MMNKILIYSLLFLLFSCTLKSEGPKDPKDRARFFAEKMYRALYENDVKEYAKYIPEEEYKKDGLTMEQFIEQLKRESKSSHVVESKIKLREVSSPLKYSKCNNEIQALLIAKSVIFFAEGNEAKLERFVYGFSKDEGNSWKYITLADTLNVKYFHDEDCLMTN